MTSNTDYEVEAYAKYVPSCLLSSSSCMLAIAHEEKRRNVALADAYKKMNEAFEEYRLKSRSNNWLKMHGYPMRRRYPK